MSAGALDVGGIFARVGAHFDDKGFDQFDRRHEKAERAAKRPIVSKLRADSDEREFRKFEKDLDKAKREAKHTTTAKLKADVDGHGFDEYGRKVKQTKGHHDDLVKSNGRLKTSFGSVWGGGGAAFAAAGGIYGLGKAFTFVNDAYRESEKVGRQTNAVLSSTRGEAGITAKEIQALAQTISAKSGVDDEAIQSSENLLLTFTNLRNETGKGNDIFNQATGIVSDMSAALGQDLKSSSIQVGKALNDPVKGITALQRVGVSFTAAQKDQIKGLVEHGKTLQAQKIIVRELTKEFGGSAAKTATPMAKLKVTIGNVAESIGKRLAPAIDAGAKKVNKLLDYINNPKISASRKWSKVEKFITDNFDKALTKAADLFEELAPKVAPKIAASFAHVGPRVALAFGHAFLKAGIWGQLLTVGFLASKFGAFSVLGRVMAERFAKRFVAAKALETAGAQAGSAMAPGMEGGIRKGGKWGKLGRGLGGLLGVGIAATIAAPIVDELREKIQAAFIDVVGSPFEDAATNRRHEAAKRNEKRVRRTTGVRATGPNIDGERDFTRADWLEFERKGWNSPDKRIRSQARKTPERLPGLNLPKGQPSAGEVRQARELQQQQRAASRETDHATDSVRKNTTAHKRNEDAQRDSRKETGRHRGATKDLREEHDRGRKASSRYTDGLKDLMARTKRTRQEAADYLKAAKAVNNESGKTQNIRRLAGDVDTLRKRLSSTRKGTKDYRDTAEDLRKKQAQLAKALDRSGDASKGAGKGYRNARGDAVDFKSAVGDMGSILASTTNTLLKNLGAKTIDFGVIKGKVGNIDKAAEIRAGGGWLGTPGDRGADVIPALVGSGEAVLNRHQQRHVELGLAAARAMGIGQYGSLDDLFDGEQTPHYLAKGGRPGRARGPARFAEGGVAGAMQRANELDRMHLPYLWGGHHGDSGPIRNPRPGLDCSSAVSYVLGIPPRVSQAFEGYGKRGKGAITTYSNSGHVFMSINGRGFGTSAENPGNGPGWLSYNSRPGFVVNHVGAAEGLDVTVPPIKWTQRAKGGWLGMGQAAADRLRKVAQAKLDQETASFDNASGNAAADGDLPGKGRSVGASMFGGPGDPGTGHIGYRGDDLNRLPNSYAELDMGHALGNLPHGAPLRITGPRGSAVALKRDIGAGGGDVQGHHRAIDLWYRLAQKVGLSGLGVVKIDKAAKGKRRRLRDYAHPEAVAAGLPDYTRELREHSRTPWARPRKEPRHSRLPSNYFRRVGDHPKERIAALGGFAQFARGKRPKGPRNSKGTPHVTGGHRQEGSDPSGFTRSEAGALAKFKSIDTIKGDIERMGKDYDLKARRFDQSEETFVVDGPDGPVVDMAAIERRSGELGALIGIRRNIFAKYRMLEAYIRRALAAYSKAKTRIDAALDRARAAFGRLKGRKGKEAHRQRVGLKERITRYGKRSDAFGAKIAEIQPELEDASFERESAGLDIEDLKIELRGLNPEALLAAAGSGDTSGDDGGTDTGTDADTSSGDATPTAEDIAAAAHAQYQSFTAGMADLFGSYGSNFTRPQMGAAGLMVGDTAQAAGTRYFGAGGGAGGGLDAGGGVTQNLYFTSPTPADPHTFTQAALHELKAAI